MEAYYRNVNTSVDYSHVRDENPMPADFHLHDRFEIYFFISGNVNYFIEKKVYTLRYGNLLVINSNEIHKPSFMPGKTYERIVIHFDPAVARQLSSPSFDLLNCFTGRLPGEQNLMCLGRKQCEEITRLFEKIESLGNDASNGSDVLKLAGFMEVLVFINRVFGSTLPPEDESPYVHEKLAPVLDYIDSHLESDLSLKFLGSCFYIDRFHLSHLFRFENEWI